MLRSRADAKRAFHPVIFCPDTFMEETLAAFRAARGSPSVDDDAAKTIRTILSEVACFVAPRRRRDAGRRALVARPRPPAPERTLEREVMADLNKLSRDTLPRLCRKIRLHASELAVESIVRGALSRSYNEYETNGVYVSLIADIVRSMAPVAAVAELIRGEVPTDDELRTETMVCPADPSVDYDAFCESCKGKRRVIGRGMTLVDLLSNRAVSDNVGLDSEAVYGCYERVMMEIVSGQDVSSPDRMWAIETLLDFVVRVTKLSPGVESLARAALSTIDVSRLNNKCRFKILDVMEG